jgi:excisionase family DNA binding protein
MNIYIVEEVAAITRLGHKTIRRLIKRGLLKKLPGIRHIRITEEELKRYLGVQSFLADLSSGHPPSISPAAPPSAAGGATKLAEINKQTNNKER